MPTESYKAKLYYNTGTYAAPVWTEIDIIGDVDVTDEKDEIDVTTRASGGFKEFESGLRMVAAEFNLQFRSGNAVYEAIRDAYNNDSNMEFAILDGAAATSGSQGLRFTAKVSKFPRAEPLDGVLSHAVKIMPCPNDDSAPAYYEAA